MNLATKGVLVVGATAVLFYVILFLISLPLMANAPENSLLHAASRNVYATLYVPVRDLLPPGNAIRETIQDYERWACSGGSGCALN